MNVQSDRLVRPRRLGRSILALVVGIAVGIVLSVGTDWSLTHFGFAPPQNERWTSQLLLLAAAYRSIYGILSAYIIARLAPNRPMGHALLAGALGTAVSAAGAAATWNSTTGQHWYPVALALTALPMAWIGAKLSLLQFKTETDAAS